MRRAFFAIFLFAFFFFATPAQAIVDPLSVPNNRFGIHILEAHDIGPAADLVNTSGGDWGYVTLVIRQNDRNLEKWQEIFNQFRRRHLIPIVRLATYSDSGHWVKPTAEDIPQWVDFLASLNWVVANRYVVLFNEPNHAAEWGSDINPQEYAQIARAASEQLKAKSEDFFILPAGLDTAAPNSATTMTATAFWQQMYQQDKDIFTLFDGWNSHSYPNPGFSASPQKTGLGSIASFTAEIAYLAQFNLPTRLPVFITETGWVNNASLDLSDYYQTAFQTVWNQSRVVAVTPFVLSYSVAPFSQFSWTVSSQDFYPHYYSIQALVKPQGQPIQLHDSKQISTNLPQSLVDTSDYTFKIEWQNTGQSIWNREDFSLEISGNYPKQQIFVEHLNSTEPGQNQVVKIHLQTPADHQSYLFAFPLKQKEQVFGEKVEQVINIVPPPSLIVKAKRLFLSPKDDDYKLVVYSTDNQVQTEFNLSLPESGTSDPLKMYNLIPQSLYRFVLLKPYYLPRQTFADLLTDTTTISFNTLIPLDFNQDQKLSLADFFAAFTSPITNFRLYCYWCL